MSTSSDVAGESEAVLAFIREHQAEVLRGAIDSLESSSPDELRATVHAIRGALGSYQLDSAHVRIAELSALLADPGTSAEAADVDRLSAIEDLRSIEADMGVRTERPA